jgi:hypothetical protein
MKKNILYILPAIALFASCGGGATIDNAALDAKVAAQVKSTTDQLKTNCDALVATTSQMRADSIMAVKNAKANMPVAVPAPKTSPAAAPAKPTAKVPVKAPVKVVKKVEVKKPETVGNGKPKMGQTTDSKGKAVIGNGKPKMGEVKKVKVKTADGKEKEVESVGNGKPKMGDK